MIQKNPLHLKIIRRSIQQKTKKKKLALMSSMEIVQNNASEEAEGEEKVMGLGEKSKPSTDTSNHKSRKKKKKKFSCRFVPRFGCMRLNDGVSMSEEQDVEGSFNVEADSSERGGKSPAHLIVMVNGIIGSAEDWRYAAKKFVKAFPRDVLVHCSESNVAMTTLDGVDVMGNRLAEEVVSVVDSHPNLRKISFVCHSLGGLIARYAIAVLYRQESIEENGECEEGKELKESSQRRANIAGLEPINFITSATPHLGGRGHKQVPVFCGFRAVEKLGLNTSGMLRRTGKHLMLRDSRDEKPPLLLQMSCDSEDLKFISAPGSFKRRVAYANSRYDTLVGWSSASLRRRNELPKRRELSKHPKYPHIINEETPSSTEGSEVSATLEMKDGKWNASEMEEAMIRGLTKLSWERIDVSFSGSIQRLFAHSTIQVKTYCLNYHGADVIQHMVDNFRV